jgi:hypothetical protein
MRPRIRNMTRATGTLPTGARRVTVKVAYGTMDVEKAAESMELDVSSEEVEAILANVDGQLATLAAVATHSAVLSRIFDELLVVSHAHSSGDDD